MRDEPIGTGWRRGLNLGGWLAQCDLGEDHVERFLRREDLERIAAWGFDHVRVPVDAAFLWDDALDARPRRAATAVLERLDTWVREAGLRWILDLHTVPLHSFARQGNGLWTERSAAAWLASRWVGLASAVPPRPWLLYDLLNEPTTGDAGAWAAIAERVIEAVRATVAEDARFIVEAPGLANPDLIEPLADRLGPEVIYGFHFYEPVAFTQQLAWWSPLSEYGPRFAVYPGWLHARSDPPAAFARHFGRYWDRTAIAALLRGPLARARARGLHVHCGELGVFLWAPTDSRYRWIEDVLATLHALDVGWCYWSYRDMGYGVVCRFPPYSRLPEYRDGLDARLLGLLQAPRAGEARFAR